MKKWLVVTLVLLISAMPCLATALTQSQHDELQIIADNLNLLKSQFDPGEHFDAPEFLYIPEHSQFFVVFPFADFGADTLKEMLGYSQELYDSMLGLCVDTHDAIKPLVTKVSNDVYIVVSVFGNDGNRALVTMDGVDVTALLDLVV